MDDFLRQDRHRIRFDWGRQGADAVTVGADVGVVVDVLSFTTTLTVALDRGATVLPYRWDGGGAVDYARQQDAVLAVGRSEATKGQISLSSGTVRCARPLERLVLPSPNGSTIAHDLAEISTTCVGASLRNATAVAEWISQHHEPATATVAVIAAGERWPDGSLRPAVEDLWGAGAVIAALHTHGWPTGSPQPQRPRPAQPPVCLCLSEAAPGPTASQTGQPVDAAGVPQCTVGVHAVGSLLIRGQP